MLLKRPENVNLYYENSLSKSSSSLILTHGYGATRKMWTNQMQVFGGQYNTIIWDIRGHGQTEQPLNDALFSEELTVQDIKALIELTGNQQAIVGGLSLGGYMSLAFYATYPQMTKALILMDTGPGYKNDEARAKWNKFANRQAEKIDNLGHEALGTSNEINAQEHYNLPALSYAARGMLAQFNDKVMQTLPTVAVPTLILVGSEDKPYHNSSEYMAKKIPNAQLVYIENAGHACNLDQPVAVNNAIASFLSTL